MNRLNHLHQTANGAKFVRGGAWLIIIIILILLILIALGLMAWWNRTPSWYTYDPPNKDTPDSVEITAGPNTIRPGVANTYTLTVTYDNPISSTKNYIVIAEIYEDDVGDVLLDRLVRLSFPTGATSASANFTLTCTDPANDGNYLIVGDNGSNTLDDTWEIFGYVKDQTTSYPEEGSNYNVSCEEP